MSRKSRLWYIEPFHAVIIKDGKIDVDEFVLN